MEEFVIGRLGHRGDGVAETPQGPVHVPFALPGERVRGRVEDGRMRGAEILAPSPDRAVPPCRHFGTCGGCAVQHASDAFVASWKADLVRTALAARGLAATIGAVVTVPSASRRRATFALRRGPRGVEAGFLARGASTLVPLAECPVLSPALFAARETAIAVCGPALGHRGKPRGGEARVLATLSESGIDLAVESASPPDREAGVRAGRAGLARLAWNGETLALVRPPAVRFGRVRVVLPPGAFLQPTAEGEAALLAAVAAIVGGRGPVADLFAGCGTFALPLAATREVHAVESAEAQVRALEAGWRGAERLRRVTTEVRDLFRRPLLQAELARFAAIVIDPPHAGAAAQAAALARARVPVIAHVSCNPATFARDARTLVDGGWRLGPVTVVDQFRWSAEVELVAGFFRD
jgi:23S rRNA (uracil1939-C5)-methyltransferase